MKKKRFLAVFFAMLIAFSTMWTFSVSAVEGEGESVPESEYVEPDTSEDVTYESEDTQPETEDTAPVTEDTQPQTQDTQSQDDSDYTQGQQSEDTQPQYNDDDNYDWNSGDDADYGNYEERENNTSSEKASTAAVYNAEKDDVSKDTLNEGDWAKIAAQLKNASQSGDDDFAFIRNNDASGANNGEWMLILGIAMEAVAVGLIGFMIYLSVKKRKALKNIFAFGNCSITGGNSCRNLLAYVYGKFKGCGKSNFGRPFKWWLWRTQSTYVASCCG